MIQISCCMIVKNEEKILARCLESIADLMDEIIIVDTGSDDRTKEVLEAEPFFTASALDSMWYYNAAHETPSILNIHTSTDWPEEKLKQIQGK